MAEMMLKQADETMKMADIMFREYELKITPFVELRLGISKPRRIGVQLINHGSVPVMVEEVVFEWWFWSRLEKTYLIEKELNKILSKDEPISSEIEFSDLDLVKDEYPDSRNKAGKELSDLITGKVYAYFLNKEGVRLQTNEVRKERIL
jgi:hypothetical protein